MSERSRTLRAVALSTVVLLLGSGLIFAAHELDLLPGSNWWGMFVALPALVLLVVAGMLWFDPLVRTTSVMLAMLGGIVLITSLVLYAEADFTRYWYWYAIWAGVGIGLLGVQLLKSPDTVESTVQTNSTVMTDAVRTGVFVPKISSTPSSANALLLSERELEVMQLLKNGLSQKEIADTLVVAASTVKAHTRNIYGKLGVGTREEALQKVRDLGVLSE
jgi:DNA-binding CsgD family transcriptional regulator